MKTNLCFVSSIQVPLPDGCLWAWSHVHCFSVSVSSHRFLFQGPIFLSWFTPLLPSRSDCSSLTSCSIPSHSYWLSLSQRVPHNNFLWQILWGTTRIPLQGGIWFVFGLDLNLSPAHARQGPPLGYIPKLRKLGRSSGESTEWVVQGWGRWSLLHATFSADRVQVNSFCLLLSAPASFLSPGVHSRSRPHTEHHLAHCSDCLSLE